MAYKGLMEFVYHLQSVPQSARRLQHVYFVNIDKETTDAMGNVMRALYEKKHMFLSQPAEKPEEKSQTELLVAGLMPGGHVGAGGDTDSVDSGLPFPSRDHSKHSGAEGTGRMGHGQQEVPQHKTPASESEQDTSMGMSEGHDTNFDGTRQQSPSDTLQQEDSGVTSDSGASSTGDRATRARKGEARRLKKEDAMKNDGENRNAHPGSDSEVVVEKGGDKSPGMNVAAKAAAAATANDDDEGKDADGSKQEDASKRARARVLKKDDCVICLEQMTNPKELDCGHKFCENCIAAYFEKGQPKCPSCGKLFGVLRGNQPPGSFTSRNLPQLNLCGYEHHGAIEIIYHIPDGIQTVSNILCIA